MEILVYMIALSALGLSVWTVGVAIDAGLEDNRKWCESCRGAKQLDGRWTQRLTGGKFLQ